MQQTRLGSSSVTSAIVTACSFVMLQTSCPPGTSFPTCFLQLWPSKFGSKLLMGRTGPPQHYQAVGKLDSLSMWLLISCPQSRTAPMQLTEDLGKKVLGSSLSLSSWDHSGLLSSGLVTYFSKSYSQVLCRRTLSKSSYGFSSLLPLLPYLGCKVFQV